MLPGYVCVSYTFMYNGAELIYQNIIYIDINININVIAVMNISYFHGKVTEDQTEGYTIEVCACKSKNANIMPCNSTIRNRYSTLIIFAIIAVSLFMYKIFDIP
ncbi:hypothetical protein ALC53_09196 [Atta colombica]|uniref:Uncharacterized protein n=1 Tax=Atta colombica TaxID=520822 RepID=A0A195B769_9HYME|nr:hypothetical protein ALC53_09196 [Atta colombica]